MKKVSCEICGSTDFVKTNGVFICQCCECKYSVEEIREMMVDEKQLQKTLQSKSVNMQGKFGVYQMQSEKETWICPECETINTKNECILCGYQKKQPSKIIPTKKQDSYSGTKLTNEQIQKITSVVAILMVVILVALFVAQLANKRNFLPTNIQESSLTLQETIMPQKESVAASNLLEPWKTNVLGYIFSGRQGIKRDVVSITFFDSLDYAPKTYTDVSKALDGSVRMWSEMNKDEISLYIAAEGGVNASEACYSLFAGCENLTSIQFNDCFHTEDAQYMMNMFLNCGNLTELDLSGFDTSNVKNMSEMFKGCTKLSQLDISGFDTSSVEKMDSMFAFCTSLTNLDLEHFNTSNVKSMNSMFCGCEELTDLNISSFNTVNVTDMGFMFWRCNALGSPNLDSFETSGVVTFNNFMNFGNLVGERPWEELFS